MDIKYHIGFSIDTHFEIWDFVQKHMPEIPSSDRVVAFDILESNPYCSQILEYVKQKKAVLAYSDMVFTKEELLAAPWMSTRTTFRLGYPQPAEDYKYREITYARNGICDQCSAGLSQADAFRLKRVPAWKRRHFFAPFWVEDELFVSDVVRDALLNANITGVTFRDVKSNSGKEIHPGVHQMYVSHTLREGLLENDASIREVSVCSSCGKKAVLSYGGVQQSYHKEIFENAPDVVKTAERYGPNPWAASSNIIINQKVYRLLVEKQLDKSLLFYPLKLV